MPLTAPSPVRQLELSAAESERVGSAIMRNVPPDGLDPDRETAILARIGASALATGVSEAVLNAITRFPRTGAIVLLIHNLPEQEAWPASPTSGWSAERDLSVLNALHLGIVQLMGLAPFAVDYENAGHLMRNVVPNPNASGTTSSWGADQEFFWHTDNPHLPFGLPGCDPRHYVPRYLTFCGIRNEEQVPTDVMPLPYLTQSLDPELIKALSAPSYDVAAPASNRSGEPLRGVPLLEYPDGEVPRVRFDRGTTTVGVPDALEPLARFSTALAAAPYENLVLGAGSFLAFDNYRTLHRRVRFTPAAPARARWLRRLYAG